jgi:hypothetical protein
MFFHSMEARDKWKKNGKYVVQLVAYGSRQARFQASDCAAGTTFRVPRIERSGKYKTRLCVSSGEQVFLPSWSDEVF